MTSQITKTGQTIQLVLNGSMQSDQSLWKEFSKHINLHIICSDEIQIRIDECIITSDPWKLNLLRLWLAKKISLTVQLPKVMKK